MGEMMSRLNSEWYSLGNNSSRSFFSWLFITSSLQFSIATRAPITPIPCLSTFLILIYMPMLPFLAFLYLILLPPWSFLLSPLLKIFWPLPLRSNQVLCILWSLPLTSSFTGSLCMVYNWCTINPTIFLTLLLYAGIWSCKTPYSHYCYLVTLQGWSGSLDSVMNMMLMKTYACQPLRLS